MIELRGLLLATLASVSIAVSASSSRTCFYASSSRLPSEPGLVPATLNCSTRFWPMRLVFHNPAIPNVKSELLEGDYPDRRLAYITDMNDLSSKRRVGNHH